MNPLGLHQMVNSQCILCRVFNDINLDAQQNNVNNENNSHTQNEDQLHFHLKYNNKSVKYEVDNFSLVRDGRYQDASSDGTFFLSSIEIYNLFDLSSSKNHPSSLFLDRATGESSNRNIQHSYINFTNLSFDGIREDHSGKILHFQPMLRYSAQQVHVGVYDSNNRTEEMVL